jgi:putative ABC transport system permease protein
MFANDLRFGVRILWTHPGFTTVAILALAIGIGASTAIFSIVHAVLLRPLPYKEAGRIVELSETARGRLTTLSPPNLADWRARTRTLAKIGAYNDTTTTLEGGFEPERMDAGLVDADVFDVLGVPAWAGRSFSADDTRPGAATVVMLGHALWQARFGGDRSLVGTPLRFDGRDYTVVGIMPPGFTFPAEIDLWFPLRLTEADLRPNQRGAHYLNAVARMQAGVSIDQVVEELNAIEASLAAQFANVQGYGAFARPILDSMIGDVRRPLLLLLGAVGFLLLIACANVSNLLLARATTRRMEIAVRSSLGASRWRIVRQLMAESVVLSVAGGLAGLLIASWGVRGLQDLLPADLPRGTGIGVNSAVLLFSLAVSMGVGMLFGIAPAIYASGDLSNAMKDARRDGAPSGGRRRLRSGLVAAEVALALVLLGGAGLAMRSFYRLSSVPAGFDWSNTLAVTLSIPDSRYPDFPAMVRFYRDYVNALASHAEVEAAGAVMTPPLSRSGYGGTFNVIGRGTSEEHTSLQVRAATAGYVDVLRIPVRRGRPIGPQDTENSQPVVVLSEEAVRQFFPGEDPIGQRLRIHVGMSGPEPVREVVGVVGDVKTRTLEAAAPPVAYVPHAQYVADTMTVFIRSKGDPAALIPLAKTQLALLDRQLAIMRTRTGDALVAAAVAQPRFRMLLLGLFASVAVALAAVGLYGVMAFSVAQRRSELGLRIALGAEPGQVLRLVMGQGLVPVVAGIAVGLAASAVVTGVMRGLLFETNPLDPVTFAAVSALLALVAMLACYIPARRATRVDPMIAMRAE